MRFFRTLLACCLLYGLLTEAELHSFASGESPGALSEGISVKSTASTFLTSVFREKGIDLDPRTWVIDDTDKVPKTWTVNSMPQCLLLRIWEGVGWVVALYHDETPYLKPILRVKAKVITPNSVLGDLGVLLLSIENRVYNGNKQLKLIAMAVIHPDIKGPELRNALRESLNNTLPLHFHDQIPNNAATVPEVIQWLKLWFVENRKSSKAITKSIKRLRWDGDYLWTAGKRRMQKDLQSVGLSEAYSKAIAQDIVAARARFDSRRWVATMVTTIVGFVQIRILSLSCFELLQVGRSLLAVIFLRLLYLGYHRFLNQWE